MSDLLRELYQETIIDHNRNPRNFKVLKHPSHQAHGVNPLCGDDIVLYLTVENDVIKSLAFQGKGCAISTASASLMTELLTGKTIQDAKKLFTQFHDIVTGVESSQDELGKLKVLAGVKEFPARVKCATLAWHTLQAALENKANTVTTE